MKLTYALMKGRHQYTISKSSEWCTVTDWLSEFNWKALKVFCMVANYVLKQSSQLNTQANEQKAFILSQHYVANTP